MERWYYANKQCSWREYIEILAIPPLGLQLYLKKTLAEVFSCEFCEISKSNFFTEHL